MSWVGWSHGIWEIPHRVASFHSSVFHLSWAVFCTGRCYFHVIPATSGMCWLHQPMIKEYFFTANLGFSKRVFKILKWRTVLIQGIRHRLHNLLDSPCKTTTLTSKYFQSQKSNKFQNKNWENKNKCTLICLIALLGTESDFPVINKRLSI